MHLDQNSLLLVILNVFFFPSSRKSTKSSWSQREAKWSEGSFWSEDWKWGRYSKCGPRQTSRLVCQLMRGGRLVSFPVSAELAGSYSFSTDLQCGYTYGTAGGRRCRALYVSCMASSHDWIAPAHKISNWPYRCMGIEMITFRLFLVFLIQRCTIYPMEWMGPYMGNVIGCNDLYTSVPVPRCNRGRSVQISFFCTQVMRGNDFDFLYEIGERPQDGHDSGRTAGNGSETTAADWGPAANAGHKGTAVTLLPFK